MFSFLDILFTVEESAESYGKWIDFNATFKLNQINLSCMKFKFKFPARMLITASLFLSCSVNCFAQKENKKFSIGIFAESGLPLGEAGKLYKSDFGTSLRLSVHAGPGFITLSGGAVFYIPNLLSVMDTVFTNVDNGDTSLNISQFKASLKLPGKPTQIDPLRPD